MSNPVAKLLQELIAKGIEARDALPVVKALMEARITSLDAIDEQTKLPSDIPPKIQRKILPRKKASSSPSKKQKVESIIVPNVVTTNDCILVNRAPVLTLWAAVVAEKTAKVSFTEALSLGSAVASLTAKGKGTSIGIYSKDETESSVAVKSDREFELLGMKIKAKSTDRGIRGIGDGGEEQDPFRSWKVLQRRFGSDLGYVCREFRSAAEAAGDSLQDTAYQFYMDIRPSIPEGAKGWGAHGHLVMEKVSSFYNKKAA